jgi:protein-disulfide isomerase
MIFPFPHKTIFKKVLTVSFLLFILGAANVYAEGSQNSAYSNNPIAAQVDGEPVYLDDLKHVRIQEALQQVYEMQTRALKEKILQKLMAKHPELMLEKVPTVTRAEIKRFYDSNSGIKELGDLKKVSAEIRDYLEKSFRQVHIEQQYQNAVRQGWVKVYLTPPNDFHLLAGVGTAMLWTEEKASSDKKVFVLEYSDFQCPFCKRVQGTLKKLRKTYSEEVQFGYRHFPLPFHKEAQVLAQAVECARDQNKFWELQELFYENVSSSVSQKEIIKLAKSAGVVDAPAFEMCLQSGKYAQRVQNDIRDGAELGIQGTPTFILGIYDPKSKTISGKMFSGAVPEEKFVRVIEQFLTSTRTEAKLNR